MNRIDLLEHQLASRLDVLAVELVPSGLFPVSIVAQPPEAEVVMDRMDDAQIIEIAKLCKIRQAVDVPMKSNTIFLPGSAVCRQ